ncbi:hypothetical protein ABPG77_004230 [Micractinium sp. CCAP 211/92]
MSDSTQAPVRTHAAAATGGAPTVAGPGIHPTSQTHSLAGGAHTPQGLERKSAAEAVGPEGVATSTTVHLTPASDPSLPPHITAPGKLGEHFVEGQHSGGVGSKIKEKAKEAWHGFKEITPGTKEHAAEFGTDTQLGGYRSTMGKR